MPKDKNHDSVFLELCNVRCREIENDFLTEDSISFTNRNVEDAIDKLNSGKAPDAIGSTPSRSRNSHKTVKLTT